MLSCGLRLPRLCFAQQVLNLPKHRDKEKQHNKQQQQHIDARPKPAMETNFKRLKYVPGPAGALRDQVAVAGLKLEVNAY